ncbi:MAG: hypothetical protein KDC56_08090 [Flavobacteriaceae bacterium]|nr:hypothetical protein [Flavobacteriaceae bacterium]
MENFSNLGLKIIVAINNMNDIFETRFTKLWVKNEVLHCIYKPIEYLEFSVAKSIVQDRIHFQQETPYPVFCDIRGIKNSEKSARDYLAKEGSSLAKAVAIFDDRYIAEVMLRFYLQRNKPLVPTKLFKDYQEAIQFLSNYR